ncbi:chemotaxis response regulator protein-glutamate methylesterase [Abditibacteriota bacterium]|nr:chemotaxis response regulator protein-glutamate methylesterase [Abditibacteriota bacterium]
MGQTIRVLLVVSSPLVLKALERMVGGSSDVEVVGVARRGREALEMMSTLRPQLLCIDDAMPVMDGLELTREVMRAQPCPILVLSSSQEMERRLALLEAGALDCIERPDMGAAPDTANAQQFVTRLKMISRVPVIGRRPSGQPIVASAPSPSKPMRALSALARPILTSARATLPTPKTGNRIVAIGASTGGPIALMTILSALPANFPHPIMCVQHVSRGFLAGLVSWLDGGCNLRVAVAEAGQRANAGTVLFPPEDHHMEVGTNGRIRLTTGPPRDGHRPSATVLFESVAQSYGSRATAVLLTGMGADGASGLCTVHEAGGDTIAQDEASCVVFGMPRVAIERGGARHILAPEDITRRLLLLCQNREKSV